MVAREGIFALSVRQTVFQICCELIKSVTNYTEIEFDFCRLSRRTELISTKKILKQLRDMPTNQ